MKQRHTHTQKINETKSWLFEKINKIDKPLARLTKNKKRAQINKIRNEKEVTTDSTEIPYHRIPEERDKFLEMCSLPKMNEEEIENMNRPVTNNEFENNNKTSQHTKVQDQMASQMKFTKHLGNS